MRVYYQMTCSLTFSSQEQADEFIRGTMAMEDAPIVFHKTSRRQHRKAVQRFRTLKSWKDRFVNRLMKRAA